MVLVVYVSPHSFLFMLFDSFLLIGILPDFRRLPNLPPTPHFLLLWHRRMLPLARLHPSLLLSPLQSPASTLGA